MPAPARPGGHFLSAPAVETSDQKIESRRGLREMALLGWPFPLCDEAGAFGPKILPLAPEHLLRLQAAGNPLVCGGRRTLAAVLQYLWCCSPGYKPYARLRYRIFCLRWRRAVSAWGQPSARALAAIAQHLAATTLDRPPMPVAKKRKDAPPAELPSRDGPHELASLELVCIKHLGYSPELFWRRSFGHTNQLLALYFAATSPDAPKFDRARDKIRGDYLRAKKSARVSPS
jgi:hypothetical protein